MTQFSVDVASVQDLAARLRGLKQEFEGLEDAVAGYEGDLGSAELADALDGFASNWSDKRKELVRPLDEVAGYAAAAAEAYASCERELSADMQPRAGSGTGGGRRR